MSSDNGMVAFDPENAVRERYAAAAGEREEALCFPVEYAANYLDAIPNEVIERDYGCGDPSPYVRTGETVLDLGSGAGKLCFILCQVVGAKGRVIGVDCNAEMLELARRNAPIVAERLGYANVDFRNGRIQDLGLDLDRLGRELEAAPIAGAGDWLRLAERERRLRAEAPLVADESVDCVVSNCVLNLVRPDDRRQLFEEIFRVLRRGGRAAISDIVSDESVPDHLRRDPELWSGCVSGALREEEFLRAFEESGFHGIEIAKRQPVPWRTVEGIEFRSVTVLAHKGKQGPCMEGNQAVIYRGPFKKVEDDDGHVYFRGERMAVCEKTFALLQREPYAGHFDLIQPRVPVRPEEAKPFDCRRSALRYPRETKGNGYSLTSEANGSCNGADGACC